MSNPSSTATGGCGPDDVHRVSQIFVKTRSCRFFGPGLCTKGAACNFAHGGGELRHVPDFSRTKMCPTLLANGACGDATCKYAHSQEHRRKIAIRTSHRQKLHKSPMSPGPLFAPEQSLGPAEYQYQRANRRRRPRGCRAGRQQRGLRHELDSVAVEKGDHVDVYNNLVVGVDHVLATPNRLTAPGPVLLGRHSILSVSKMTNLFVSQSDGDSSSESGDTLDCDDRFNWHSAREMAGHEGMICNDQAVVTNSQNYLVAEVGTIDRVVALESDNDMELQIKNTFLTFVPVLPPVDHRLRRVASAPKYLTSFRSYTPPRSTTKRSE